MKKPIMSYFAKVRPAIPFIIAIWVMVVTTIIILRLTSVDVLANATPGYWVVIGTIITALAVPVHHWFKNRKPVERNRD